MTTKVQFSDMAKFARKAREDKSLAEAFRLLLIQAEKPLQQRQAQVKITRIPGIPGLSPDITK